MDSKIFMLLIALAVALVVSAVACLLALVLFPWFRSGERKEGHFRADQSSGSIKVDTRRGLSKLRATRANSNELPLVGGPAMILAILAAGVGAGYFLNLPQMQWKLLITLLLATVCYGIIGFLDDWRKVQRGEGISEIQKGAGVLFVSFAAAVALNRLVVSPRLSARLAYPPYSDIPLLGNVLIHTKLAWVIFFLVMTALIVSGTSLAVDFADGMDGLCGGLVLSSALSFAAILLGEGDVNLLPGAIAMLAIAGATAGFLPFNWPSSWKARNLGRGPRRAKMIMGDSGSLALGGLLALVAVISRLEFVLIFIGGVFVLEGLSALISARILVRFFRMFLRLERYNSSGRGFPHTEFPLPFLATPMHHHYDLLGWDRKRLVYGAWLLGAGLGLLGVASVIGTFTWERYLARFAAFLVLVFIWQSGPWTRSFFIGLSPISKASPTGPRFLTLYYGFPFKLFGRSLFARVDSTDVQERELETPAERLSLWQRMSVFDARATLGYYCYRAGAFEDAQRVWGRIPKGNLEWRPEIAELLAEVRHTLALQADNPDGALVTATSSPRNAIDRGAGNYDPNATVSVQMLLRRPDATNSNSSARYAAPEETRDASIVADAPGAPEAQSRQTGAPLWSAPVWVATNGSQADIPQDPVAPEPPLPAAFPPLASASTSPTPPAEDDTPGAGTFWAGSEEQRPYGATMLRTTQPALPEGQQSVPLVPVVTMPMHSEPVAPAETGVTSETAEPASKTHALVEDEQTRMRA
jgi:UDP-N-acetylmuramyl pentapeptide phosphotransferase/UDP-N-acetylglucosamine-1-phosphate transferase